MKQIQYLISMFTKITTGTLLICAILITLNGIEIWTTMILWQILAVSLATSFITVILLPERELSKKESIIRYILHYIMITAIILLAGWLFDWYSITLLGFIFMIISVGAVYGFTALTTWLSCKHSADELNKILEQRRNNQNKD